MTEDKIWQYVVLKLSGEASEEQLAVLEQALKDHPAIGFQLGILEAAWNSKAQRHAPDKATAFDRHLQRLSNHLSADALQYDHIDTAEPERLVEEEDNAVSPKGTILKKLWWSMAAAACLIIVGLLVFKKDPVATDKKPAGVMNLVSTRNGSKSKLQLPDGTEVWLNSGSRISYGNDFTGALREVTLHGEAYFDVVHDTTRPFIIHTDAVDIRVLGTAFNVRSYPDEQMMETALIRGSVEVTLHKSPGKKIVLKPSEKLIVRNDSSVVVDGNTNRSLPATVPLMALTQVRYVPSMRDSATVETLWTKNKLAFEAETLEQVALKLERWFGVEVTIQGEKLRHTEYSGVFEEENLSEVLYALQLSGKFQYTIRKNEVILRP